MSTDATLTERVRAALNGQSAVREVAMFGGQAFMVNENLLVSVGRDLLVRTDPGCATTLLAVEGVRQAEMAGRSMGPSWIRIAAEQVATDEGLSFWLDVALSYNRSLVARRHLRRSPTRPAQTWST